MHTHKVWVVASLVALASVAWTQGKLTGVEARKLGPGVEVQIQGEGLAQPKQIVAFGGKSLILEFDANLVGSARRVNVRHGGLEYYNYAWFTAKPPKVRVHLRLSGAQSPKVEENGNGWIVRVGNPVAATPAQRPAVAAVSTAANPLESAMKPVAVATQAGGAPPAKDPLYKPFEPNPEPLYPVQPKREPVQPAKPATALITLDFVNTEIVQILKAIALQANANIVTAPDMKGALTIALDKVKLDEALDLVTSLAGLRYAKVGKTYVVAPKDKFAEIMRSVNKSGEEVSETRIVPVYSGETNQIRSAVLKAFPQDSGKGSFDIILAADSAKSESAASKKEPDEGKGDAKGSAPAKAPEGTPTAFRELYVLLVGNKSVLDEVQRLVEAVDRAICSSYGIQVPDHSSLVQHTYLLQSDSMSAKSLIDVVSSLGGTAFRNVEMYPSPVQSDRQAIVMVGRSTEVERATKMLEEFDSAGDQIKVYDVKFLDPRPLREELVSHVPGLRVSIPSASAANPRLYQPGAARTAATEGLTAEKGTAADVSVKGDRGVVQGLEQPFIDLEKTAQPLKLILRGTAQQIEKALDYLALVDVMPKQVAIDMRVMELTKEDALRLGLDWSILTGGAVKAIRFNQGLGDTTITPGTVSAEIGGTDVQGSVLGTLDQIANSRNLVARPNMLAIDGRETEIFVGDVIRYIESIQSSQNGVTVTTNSVRVGVRCAIIARVGADGKMLLDMRPVVSYLRGWLPVPGGGQLPQTSERVVQSTIQMDSGETIALGGLIRDEDRKAVSGIPLLKDIPILGQLFKRTDNSRVRTEVVFFLTARVVGPNDRSLSTAPAEAEKRNPNPEEMSSIKPGKKK